MTKPIPTIQRFMTNNPHSIGLEQSIATAHRMMKEHHIRHLPVLHGGKLEGIVSERDLQLLEYFEAIDPKTVMVDAAMSTNVYSVAPDAPLDEVVSTMAEHKYGSAVIIQNQKVVGIFTTVDVCRAFGEMLNTRLAK